jgi:hypothetical protein
MTGIPEHVNNETVYFCEDCGLVVNIHSNPERLYFCGCGKTGDYINCKTMKFGEYIYDMMKILADENNIVRDGIDTPR